MKKAIKWILILAILGGGGFWIYRYKVQPKEEDVPSYDPAKVERRDIRITVETTGEVQPRNRLDVKPPIAGRLEELMVDEGDAVKKGQILGWISSTERATLLDAALATSREEYDYWADLYKPSPLISPLNGTIIARNFEPGQSIGVNDAVVVIADDLIIIANLDETDIGQVKTEQAVNVALEAYPDREFSCAVEKIAYDAKTVSAVTMYEVDVRPDRLPGFARSGMTANLEFIVEEQEDVLAVPAAAIQQKSGTRKGGGDRPDLQNMSPEERKQFMTERLRERGLSDAEIEERLARFAQGGGRPGGGQAGGEGPRPGGRRGGETAEAESFVLVPSDDPENPVQTAVKVGVSDGSYTEITEGLEEGDEVLIQRITLGSRAASSSSFMSPFGGRRR
jgi:macrolide-specific efflux system membrane fusion protein